jgi:hypothetical protein
VFPFANKQFAIQPRVPKNSTNFTNLKNPMLVKNKLKTKKKVCWMMESNVIA